MHGGAPGSGAPKGERNGNYRNGIWTNAGIANRRALQRWMRLASDTIATVE
jgi:hypothetical protein